MTKLSLETDELIISNDTPLIEYTPESVDEWVVIVKDPSDWEEIHNYIINENEIDGIPNRKIDCINDQTYSVRTSIYSMSPEEADILRTHPKIETVELNPEKYPQAPSQAIARYGKNVGFNKPQLVAALDSETTTHVNGVRSNWSHLFADSPSSEPFKGVGITSTTFHQTDVEYSLTGKNIDAVIIDSGVAHLHPEFLKDDGTYRVKDLILDGPYKVDPEYFETNGYTYTKVVDGVNLGVGIATTAARTWWSNSAARSAQFSALGTVSIDSRYDVPHVATKTSNPNSNQLIDGHGTACASQIGGKSFGLAFECNLWNIRIALGGVGGYLDSSVALNACTIFHNAKKISQNNDPDPTITNNSYGYTSSTSNSSGVSYTHNYRGSTISYTGSGSVTTIPASAGGCRNNKYFSYNNGFSSLAGYGGSGEYTPTGSGVSTDAAAESAIAAGVIVAAAAGNQNQKLADATDVDFDNWYSSAGNYIHRLGAVQKGFSGTYTRKAGTIRVGALDCSVEPAGSRQGATPYSIRKVCYSNCGPMITIWAPGEMTMAAGYYGGYEDFQRQDNTNFYDTWFNGTSAATPNAVSLICLYLQSNRKANQLDVINWLDKHGSVEIDLSDPYSDPNGTGYWTENYNSSTDFPDSVGDSYNYRGNGSLRGATKRVIRNPFSSSRMPKVSGVNISGLSFKVE